LFRRHELDRCVRVVAEEQHIRHDVAASWQARALTVRSITTMNYQSSPAGVIDADVYRRRPTGGHWPPAPAPTPEALADAAALLRTALSPTPLILSEPLSQRFGRQVYLKLELLSPIRSFKHRGAIVAVDRIVAGGTGVRTVVTASTGNHGQGVAFAARRAGLAVRVFAPESSAIEKVEAMRRLGADVEVVGASLDEAQKVAEAATGPGSIYVEDGESADLMAGAATVMSEMLEAVPDLDAVIVPVGGGNLIAGTLLARSAIGSGTAVIGVQSREASGATRSWLSDGVVEASCTTFAGGLATTRPGRLALSVMVQFLDTVAIVGDDDLRTAMALVVALHGVHLEGAAAAPVAAIERFGAALPGSKLGLVLTGNWASQDEVRRAVALADGGVRV
jgi:threonine dehydratase